METYTGTVTNKVVRPKVIFLKVKFENNDVGEFVAFKSRGEVYDQALAADAGEKLTVTGDAELDDFKGSHYLKILVKSFFSGEVLCTENQNATADVTEDGPPGSAQPPQLPHDPRNTDTIFYASLEDFAAAGFSVGEQLHREYDHIPMTSPNGDYWSYSSRWGRGNLELL